MPRTARPEKKERRSNPEARAREEKALDQRVDDGLKGTFPASDPVAVGSSVVRAARRRRRNT